MKPIKTINFPTDHLIDQDRDVINELVHAYLVDQGIKAEAFAWSINVDYVEDEL